MQLRQHWISPLFVQSLMSTGSPALSIFLNVDIWILCAIVLLECRVKLFGEDAVVIYGQVICRQICPPILVLVGELHGVEFTVGIADLAGRVSDQDYRHADGIVGLLEVGAPGRHAHVVRIEQLLDPPGLLHGKPCRLHLVQLLVLLVVEGGDAVGDGYRAKRTNYLRDS